MQQLENGPVVFSCPILVKEEATSLFVAQLRVDILHVSQQVRCQSGAASTGGITDQGSVHPHRRFYPLDLRRQQRGCISLVLVGVIDDLCLQLCGLPDLRDTEAAARIIRQGMHDRRVKIVAVARQAVECLTALVVCLKLNACFDQVFFLAGGFTADAVEQHASVVAFAYFNAKAVGPTRQLLQRVQRQAPAVRRGDIFAAQTGICRYLSTLPRVPAGLLQQAQRYSLP